MEEIYQMEKTFEELVNYTVGQIEELTSIKIVSINGISVEKDYKIKKNDKAIITLEMPQKKKVLIKD